MAKTSQEQELCEGCKREVKELKFCNWCGCKLCPSCYGDTSKEDCCECLNASRE